MIKAIAIAATLALTSVAANAAEVGIRHTTGSQHQTVTHGRAWNSYNGRVKSVEVEVNGAGGGAGRINAGGGVGSFDVTRTRTREYYRGGSTNNFSGGSNSTFSETTIFAD